MTSVVESCRDDTPDVREVKMSTSLTPRLFNLLNSSSTSTIRRTGQKLESRLGEVSDVKLVNGLH